MEDERKLVNEGEVLVGQKGHRWRVIQFLGRGSFGAVVLAEELVQRLRVAIKVEDANQFLRTLRQEARVLEIMNLAGKKHCCQVYDFGRKDEICNWMAMDLVGKSIMALRQDAPNKRFTLYTSLYLARESMRAIEELHQIGYIHRDIKPANFAMGLPPRYRDVYILDFGMARQYRKASGVHRKARESPGFRGTPKYASVSALNEQEQSRRDDMISWLFMIIEFTTGSLPWTDHQYRRIRKISARLRQMAEDRACFLSYYPSLLLNGSPTEYLEILLHVHSLSFDDVPDYEFIDRRLYNCMVMNGLPEEASLDFEPQGQPPVIAPQPVGYDAALYDYETYYQPPTTSV